MNFRWSKNNPYKVYNMKLIASRKQKDCKILSNDEDLINSTNVKIVFICPNCRKIYKKKWCHWLAQKDNCHFCPDCSSQKASSQLILSYEQLKERYKEHNFDLISDYDYYLNNGMSYARMFCSDKYGYQYAINLNSLRNGTIGNKFATSNPFSLINLQKFCKDHNLDLEIIKWISNGKRNLVEVLCTCKKHIFYTEPHKIVQGIQYRCYHCSQKESKYEYKTKLWLQEYNIYFKEQYRFEDCKYKRTLPFDFYCIKDDKIIMIEVDGPQHYYEDHWFNEFGLQETKIKDNIKTNYCINKGYILLRLPFWEFYNKNGSKYKESLYKTFFS